MEDRVDAELGLGRHTELVDELYRLVRTAPLRERLLAQLVLALSRCGRRGRAARPRPCAPRPRRPRDGVPAWRPRPFAAARGIGGQRQLAKALNARAALHHESGDTHRAESACREALTLARDRGDRCGEIEALAARVAVTLAELQRAQGQLQDTAATVETALSIHTGTGQRLGRACAHLVLAKPFAALGDGRRSCEHCAAAEALLTECGAGPL